MMYCGARPSGGKSKLVGRWRSLLEWPEPLLLKDCAVRGEASPTSQAARMSCCCMTWLLPGANQQDTRVHYRDPVMEKMAAPATTCLHHLDTQACPGALIIVPTLLHTCRHPWAAHPSWPSVNMIVRATCTILGVQQRARPAHNRLMSRDPCHCQRVGAAVSKSTQRWERGHLQPTHCTPTRFKCIEMFRGYVKPSHRCAISPIPASLEARLGTQEAEMGNPDDASFVHIK